VGAVTTGGKPERARLHVVGGGPEALQDLADLVGDRFEIVLATASMERADSASELLLGAIGEAVCLADARGGVVWANAFYQHLDEDVRREVSNACRDAARQIADAQAARAASKRAPAPPTAWKISASTRDESRIYDVYVTSIDAARTGGDQRLAVVLRDVTVQRKTQQKMDAIDRAGTELSRFDAEQIRRMDVFQRLDLLRKKIVGVMHDLLQFDHFVVFQVDRKRSRLQVLMSEGLPEEIGDLELFSKQDGNGISGFVAATGKSYICHDAASDERYLPGLTGAQSSLTVPLIEGDQVIGVLDVESREPGSFDEQDRQFAEMLGRHIATAIRLLDLLVAERCEVNAKVSDRFEDELAEPLNDISHELDWLRAAASKDPETAAHLSRIEKDVADIRERMRCMGEGPQTLLGVDRYAKATHHEPWLVGKRVLIADDQPKIRKIIGEILGHRGGLVTVCACGEDAIAEIAKAGAGNAPPFDLVVSDIQMPDRNGYEVFHTARRHFPAVRVILMTGFGYDPHHSIVRASQEGLSGVLFKPFEIELLMQQVRKALDPSPVEKA
jgi:CheY-like chemotaxis protein